MHIFCIGTYLLGWLSVKSNQCVLFYYTYFADKLKKFLYCVSLYGCNLNFLNVYYFL